jgi:hypothetical protein
MSKKQSRKKQSQKKKSRNRAKPAKAPWSQRPEIKADAIYDMPDVAELAGYSLRHVYNLIAADQLITFKDGKLRRMRGQRLLEHIAEREDAAA